MGSAGGSSNLLSSQPPSLYRGTSLINFLRIGPWSKHRALVIAPLQGPRGRRFLINEVQPYCRVLGAGIFLSTCKDIGGIPSPVPLESVSSF